MLNIYIFTYATLLVPITSSLLGLFVLTRNPKNIVNQLFFMMSSAIALWGFFLFILCFLGLGGGISIGVAYFLNKMLHFWALLIPAFFFHLVVYLIKKPETYRGIIRGMYTVALVTACLSFSPLMIPWPVPKYGFTYWVSTGPLYPLHLLVFFGLVAFGNYLLLKNYRNAEKKAKNQIFYFALANLVGFFGGSLNYLLNYGINIYPFSAYANLLVIGYVLLVAYAIVQHHLMDITIIIRRGLLYSAVVAVITGLYIAFITVFNQLIVSGEWNSFDLHGSGLVRSASFLSGGKYHKCWP